MKLHFGGFPVLKKHRAVDDSGEKTEAFLLLCGKKIGPLVVGIQLCGREHSLQIILKETDPHHAADGAVLKHQRNGIDEGAPLISLKRGGNKAQWP